MAPLFNPSMMVHFRSRFTEHHHQRINEKLIARATHADQSSSEKENPTPSENDNDSGPPPPTHEGKLLVDATATPADITYPTDLKLLGEAREKTEKIIDLLHVPFIGIRKKPRTYRQKARRQHLAVAKQKKPGMRKIRKAIGQQLRYLKRNLGHIEQMLENGVSLTELTSYQLKSLQVIHELYRQQKQMHQERTHSIPDRIVSIS